ncbi:hypothetical protein AB8880_01185 [Alphaproteobacteria bacterium LSUCC0684]
MYWLIKQAHKDANLFPTLFNQPAVKQLAFTRENGVGDGGDLAVEILEGKAGFKVQIARLKTFSAASGEALQVTFAAFSLAMGEFGFFLDQPAGNPDIMGDEHIAGDLLSPGI